MDGLLTCLGVLAVLSTLGGAPSITAAQTASGSVTGQVRDSTGHPLAQAQVYIVGAKGGTLSDSTGHYRLRDVPSGAVVLEAKVVGYPIRRDTIVLRGQDVARVDFVLWPPTTLYDPVIVDSVCAPDGRCRPEG
jgi:outer membrane receptor for ferrienterochelin and colicins